ASGGGDRKLGRTPQLAEPSQVRAAHRSLRIDIRAEKSRRIFFELWNDFVRTQTEFFLPAAHQNFAVFSIESHYDFALADFLLQGRKERVIDCPVFECRASNDNFLRAPARDSRSLRHGANPAADADTHLPLTCGLAQRANQLRVASLAHRRVE